MKKEEIGIVVYQSRLMYGSRKMKIVVKDGSVFQGSIEYMSDDGLLLFDNAQGDVLISMDSIMLVAPVRGDSNGA